MINTDDLLPDNIIIIFHQKIIIFRDNSCRRILDREYRIIRFPVLNGLHGIFPALHMEIIAVFSKKLFHGKLAVGTFESLKNNPCIGIIQRVNRLKLLRRHNSMLRQQFILFLTAHRHDLLKKFTDSVSGKITFRSFLQRCQLGFLSLLVKNLLPGIYFVFSHIRGQFHPFLIEFYDLFVNFINIFSDI